MKILDYTQYKIFRDNLDNNYLYITDTNSLFKADNNVLKIIQQEGNDYEKAYNNISDVMNKEEFENLVLSLEREGLLQNNKEIIKKERKSYPRDVRGITLMISQDCNLRCTYCYGDGGEYFDKGHMSFEVAQKAVDFLVKNSITKDPLLISFLGGEPLINFKLIKEVVQYCKYIMENSNKKFRYSITTNGTVFNDEINKFLIENKFTTQISVDGKKEVHDINRIYSSGKGSFEKLKENTKFLRENSFITARATITGTNLDLIENFEELEKLGFVGIPMAPAQNLLTEEEYEILIEKDEQLSLYFLNLIQNGDYKRAKKLRMPYSMIEDIHDGKYKKELICGSGNTMCAIDINGKIYPCHRFVGIKEQSIGSVFDNTFENKEYLDTININNRKQCNKCWARTLCVGGCSHENLVNGGDFLTTPEKHCKYIKSHISHFINVYINLNEEEKKILFN